MVCECQLTHTVVTQAAVGGAGGPEHLAGEAVLELHHLLVDHHLLSAGGWPIAGVPRVICTGEGQRDNSVYSLIKGEISSF